MIAEWKKNATGLLHANTGVAGYTPSGRYVPEKDLPAAPADHMVVGYIANTNNDSVFAAPVTPPGGWDAVAWRVFRALVAWNSPLGHPGPTTDALAALAREQRQDAWQAARHASGEVRQFLPCYIHTEEDLAHVIACRDARIALWRANTPAAKAAAWQELAARI